MSHIDDCKREIELLTNRMSVRTPVLVIGAGFSCGALNDQQKPLPTGKMLANELFDELLEKLPETSSQYLEEYRCDRDDLLKTCDNIREENLVKRRDKYITQRMKGCHCDSNDYHMFVKRHPWKHIFTLNIDDLLEYIYKSDPSQKEPNIHIKGKSQLDSEASFDLYKLHGSVRNPLLGYIFDSEEYREYMSESAWALERFGQLFLTNDVIFLGTEFQEVDLLFMIEKFMKMVDIKHPYHYFFISPNIHNRKLRRDIEKLPYMHYIPWDTKQFLTHIKNAISDVEDARRKMRDYGAIFYNEKKQESIKNPTYGSELYYGMPPRPIDFFQEVDIVRPNLKGTARSISTRGGNRLIILHGMPYVGKTCAALRLGVDLMESGYEFLVFNLPISMDAKTYASILLEYLGRMPEGAKVAVLAENMPDFYGRVKKIMKECPSHLNSFVFICTAITADHDSKKYLLDECPMVEEFSVTEKTNEGRMAEAIYDKLAEKNHLNKLRLYGDSWKECIQYIKQVNDIIDVLYIAQEGRGFVEHFSEWIDNKATGEELDAFLYLNVLLKLGIPVISKSTFVNLLTKCGIKIDVRMFLNNYNDLIRFEEDKLTLRCSRLLWDSVRSQLSNEIIVRRIISSVKHIVSSLKEGDETIDNSMFQKLTKANNLHWNLNLSYNVITVMLLELEESCKHLSYYWVQRGISNREIEEFEEANNAFSEAASIRNNTSFHIKHAQAKNYMQWGLWAADHQPSMATTLFTMGKDRIEDLIINAPERYYAYSVHTYVDMMMRFYKKSEFDIDLDKLSILLQKLLVEHNDKLNQQITKDFLDFCIDRNATSSEINTLKTLYQTQFPNCTLHLGNPYLFDSDDLAD